MREAADAQFLRRLGASALSFGGGGGPVVGGLAGYEVIEEIGRGGMGVVYLARQAGLDRIVALKVIHASRAAAVEADTRLLREARTAARLRHRHIVAVHESGHAEGQAFYSMDYLDGGDLATRMRSVAFQPIEAAHLVAKLAEAVAYAHREGVVHRDLKPGNVLLDGSGEPRIADFGLAAPLEPGGDLTAVTAVLGTPHYLAPEGFTEGSAALGVASDIYALGAILYELLCGRAPFAGTNSAELPAVVATREPAAPRLFNASVEADLQTICLKCLEKQPAARYAGAQELADDLGRYLRLEPIRARPLSAPARAWRWARRRPALAAAWVLLMALAAGAIASAWMIARERAAATEQLRVALIAQAKSSRLTGQLGQRFDALAALQRAGGIRMGSDLRNEALAALALPDVRIARRWKARAELSAPVGFDPEVRHYVTERVPGELVLRRVVDDLDLRVFAALPGRPRAVYVGGWSADGRRFIARFAGGTVAVFGLESPAPLCVLPKRPAVQPHIYFATDLWLSPDGRHFCCAHPEGGVGLHEVAGGAEIGRFRLPGEEGTAISFLAVSPDGARVALAGQRGRRVSVLDFASGALLAQFQHGASLVNASWDPSGRRLVTSAVDQNLQIWDFATGALAGVLEGHRGIPIHFVWRPDGAVLASTGRDFNLRLWDLATRRSVLEIPELGGGVGLTFSRDGRRLAFTDAEFDAVVVDLALDDMVRLVRPLLPGDYYEENACLDLTRDGRLAVLASRSGVRLVDPESGRALAMVDGPGAGEESSELRTALFSPLGDAVFYSASTTGIWRRAIAGDGPTLQLGPPEQLASLPNMETMAIDPGGRRLLIVGERSSRAAIIDLARAERRDIGLDAIVSGAAFSPDGSRLLTTEYTGGSAERAMKLWDTASATLVRTLPFGDNGFAASLPGTDLAYVGSGATSVACRWPDLTVVAEKLPPGAPEPTRDGRMLALRAGRVDLLRVRDWKILGSLPINTKAALRFHPDGGRLYVYSEQRLEAWDLRAMRRELARLGLDWEGEGF